MSVNGLTANEGQIGTAVSAEDMKVRGEELAAKVKALLHEGNVRRIALKNSDGHTIIEIPVSAAVVAAVVAPVLTAVGAVAALASYWQIEVHREDSGTPVS